MARTERGHYANLKTDEVGRSVIASGAVTTDGQRIFGQGTSGGLAGSALGSAVATGAIVLALALSGTAAGHGGASGALTENLALSGTSAGQATASGNLLLAGGGHISGTASGTGTASGRLALGYGFSGTSSGTSSASGTVTLRLRLTGTAAGAGSASGSLSVAVVPALNGSAHGVGAAHGRLGYLRSLSGSAHGVASTSGTLSYFVGRGLSGTSTGVGTASGSAGAIPAPDNDPFSSPTTLTGSTGTAVVNTVGSTYEHDSVGSLQEPDPAVGTGSVWYVYTPSSDGTLHVGTGQTPAPAWQSRVDVYTGDTFDTLTSVALGDLGSDPQPGITDSLTAGTDLMVTGGVTYHVRVQDAGAARSDAVLNWSYASVSTISPAATVTLVSPGVSVFTVQINASNLPPNEVLTFSLQNLTTLAVTSLTDTATADSSGTIAAASISLIPSGASTLPTSDNYYLVVDASGTFFNLPFTLSVLEGDVPQALPTPPSMITPPPSGVMRWVFEDVAPSASPATWTVPLNPDQMTSPYPDKNITDEGAVSPEGITLLFEGVGKSVDWQFSGSVVDQAHYDNLVYWFQLKRRVYIHDHFGRVWEVYLTGLDLKPVRAVNKPWRHTYTMKAKITRGPIDPTGQLETFDTTAAGTIVDSTNYAEGYASGILFLDEITLSGSVTGGLSALMNTSASTAASVLVSMVNTPATAGTFTGYVKLTLTDNTGGSATTSETSVNLIPGSLAFERLVWDLNALPNTVNRTLINQWRLDVRLVQTSGSAPTVSLPVNLDDLRVL